MSTNDEWVPRTNGFVKGSVGVFPALDGWQIFQFIHGDCVPVRPLLCVLRETRTHDPDRSPPFVFTTRTREQMIEEAKRLAELFAQLPKHFRYRCRS